MDSSKTVAQITTEDYRTAVIFKNYGIDFCCGGKKTVQEACDEKQINLEELTQALENSTKNLITENNYDDWELDFLAEFIIQTHHTYVRKRLPEIKPFLNKVVTKHGEKHPELTNVGNYFHQVEDELTIHMQKEEQIIFPFIKDLVKAEKERRSLSPPMFGSIKNPISMMELEHEQVGNVFKNIRKITNDLIPPENACKSYRILFSMLNEFEENLHLHIHLENNILFPKSIDLENRIVK